MKITNNVKEFFKINDPFNEYAGCYIYLDDKGIAQSTEWDANNKPIIVDDHGDIMTYESLMNKIKDCYVDSVEVDWRIAIYLHSRNENDCPKNMKLSARSYFKALMPGGYKDVTIFFDGGKTKTIKHPRTPSNEYYKTFDKIAEEYKDLTVHHTEAIDDARGRRLRVYLNPSKN